MHDYRAALEAISNCEIFATVINGELSSTIRDVDLYHHIEAIKSALEEALKAWEAA